MTLTTILAGYDGIDQSPGRLQEAAAEIGFPLLIKAVMGGGGKGMKLVNQLSEFKVQGAPDSSSATMCYHSGLNVCDESGHISWKDNHSHITPSVQ